MLPLSRFHEFVLSRAVACIAVLVGSHILTLAAPAANAIEFWYDFEGDSGDVVTDKLSSDGAQDGSLEGNTSIQSDDVLFGTKSARFDIPDPIGVGPAASRRSVRQDPAAR